MNRKRYLFLFLSCIMVVFFSINSIVSAISPDTNVKKSEDLRIEAQNIKVDTSKPIDTEVSGDKILIHTNIKNSDKITSAAAMAADLNRPPIADLRCMVLNTETLTTENNFTTDTYVAWLWSYNGINYTYDPDGDAITNIVLDGIPSDSLIFDAYDENGNAVGFILRIITPGTYAMNFRCQDEHGIWSDNWSVQFYVAPSKVKAIACGNTHAAVLKADGTVWTWGQNDRGQLGDGTLTNRTTPVKVQGLSGVKAITCSAYSTYAVKDDGTVWAWGSNSYGALGNGTASNSNTPVQVSGLTGVKDVIGGSGGSTFQAFALKEDGTTWAWGYNGDGQLGDGTTINRNTPVQVTGLDGVKVLASGTYNTMALKEDGTVWIWGLNDIGQLGDGTTVSRSSPVQLTGLSGAKDIGCGDIHFAVLKENGTVWTWGSNSWWGLGYGTKDTRTSIPTQVSGLSGVKEILISYFHNNVLKEDGTVWAWGADSFSQLINNGPFKKTPTLISGFTGITSIASGTYFTIGLKSDGSVWAWGTNDYGQLGDGTTTSRSTPVAVKGLK
jgi:alpha-tubulin suppressor-like RCC1 family protein